jgi:ankyrin repeat protein
LHWACHTRSEMALTYLLSFNPDLNIQDHEGKTPLHMAVKNADPSCRSRCVRFLLLRGARVDIRDKEGKLAQDYI